MAKKIPADTGVSRGLIHFNKAAPLDTSFPKDYTFHVINTPEQLAWVARKFMKRPENARYLGFDIETTSLNPENRRPGEQNFIVGVSYCFEQKVAYYTPLAHKITGSKYDNFPDVDFFWQVMSRMLKEAHLVLLYNARFDLRWCDWHNTGVSMDNVNYFDVAIPVWMVDTNFINPSLKWAARHFLGWDPMTFEDVLGSAQDFSCTAIDQALFYAASDALMTVRLYFELKQTREEFARAIAIDNKVLRSIWRMEETYSPIDLDHLWDLHTKANRKAVELHDEIIKMIGKPLNLGSPKQIVAVLRELGVDTGKETASGQMSTDAAALESIADDHPFVAKLVEHRKIVKLLTTYLQNMMDDYRVDKGGVRFSYQTTRTPTGRLAGGTEKANAFFARGINIQAITKAKTIKYAADWVGTDTVAEDVVLGWRFYPDEDGAYKGFRNDNNLRMAWKPYPHHWFVHIDYSTQELRIPANMSGEPTLVNAFLNNIDLHKDMAGKIWGVDQVRARRQDAKALNFGALYGGTKYAFADQIGCSLDEAQAYLDIWWGVMSTLDAWRKKLWSIGKTAGYVTTYFGRPRRVKTWYNSSSFRAFAFANRTVVNTVVQGGAADIMKMAMIRIDDEVSRVVDPSKFHLLSQVHDELNFSISKEEPFFSNTVQQLARIMSADIPGWKVPMLVEASVGSSWGWIFPFEYNADSARWEPIKD